MSEDHLNHQSVCPADGRSSYQHTWHNGQPIDVNVGKAVCVGKNYADHVKEMEGIFKETNSSKTTNKPPVLFIKPRAALCSADPNIQISHLAHLGEIHHELEIALLIGNPLDSQSEAHLDAIIGIGLAIDLTLRDVQTDLKNRGLPWERAKSFDGSCPVSSFIPFSNHDSHLELNNLDFELRLNEQIRQRGNSTMMLTTIEALLREITVTFSLEQGDIVLTGTPAGVGPLQAGDVLSATLNQQILINSSKLV